MKEYKVLLHRDYIVNIKAKNEDEAKFLAEFFIGGEKDLANKKDKETHQFEIEEIEMTVNDAFEVEEVENHEK